MSTPSLAPALHTPWPRRLAWLWLAGAALAGVAVAALLVRDGSHWDAVRHTALVLKWHTVASVLCCVGLLVLSKPRGAEHLAAWAPAAQLWVLGGLLAALVQQVGALPQWQANSTALLQQLAVAALWLVQLLCAVRTVRALQRWRAAQGPKSPSPLD